MQKIEVSVCIVAYGALKELRECLKSVYASKSRVLFEVIVVDNNQDSKAVTRVLKSFPEVRYIKSLHNVGYGGGNNLAIQHAKGEYVLILNPDTQVKTDTLTTLHRFLKKNKRAAIVAPTLVDESGQHMTQLGAGELTPLRAIFSLTMLHKMFPNNPIAKSYYLSNRETVTPIQVDAVPGSAFLMRKQSFYEVGGYDENFFLYFEESDLGRRLRRAGYELWITPDTQVNHGWGKSTKMTNQDNLKSIFNQSRFRYFRKHFGLLQALLVETFARVGMWELLFMVVLVVSALLRFYALPDNVVFHGELGHNYLAMKNFMTTGIVPLLGPPTSHPWLSFGPLFYWIFSPVLVLVQYTPLGMAYIFALIHTLLLPLNYWVISRLFTRKVALISSIIIGFSPQYLEFARESRFFSLTLVLFYPLLYFLVKRKFFWAALIFSAMLHFHLTPLIYVPAIGVYVLMNRQGITRQQVLHASVGFVIPQLPFLIYNALSGWQMLVSAISWIPYRVAGFLGIVPKNTVSPEVIAYNTNSLYVFVQSTFVRSPWALGPIILTAVISGGVWVLYKRSVPYVGLLMLFLVCGYLGIFVHGNPPSHYYLPLFGPLILLVANLLGQFRGKWAVLTLMGLAAVSIFNINNVFSSTSFYGKEDVYSSDRTVPLGLQKRATQSIIDNAQGASFKLKRTGPSDHFEGDYAQNYQYLLWLEGHEPDQNSILTYHIYEGTAPTDTQEIVIFEEGNIWVTLSYDTK